MILPLAFALLSSLPALNAGNHTIDLSFQGTTRSYIVHVPRGTRPGRALPLVVNLHGGGSNASAEQKYTGMDRLADREGFVVVYPNGSGHNARFLTWNAGTCCATSQSENIDDVGFIRAVVADVESRTSIDRHRIYATGMSNGAMMTYRLAVEASDLFAAFAPVAGTMMVPTFHPTRRVPILHIQSVDDPRAMYYGGVGPPFPFTHNRVDHPPVEQQLDKWIAYDGCATPAQTVRTLTGAPGSADEGNGATLYRWSPCNDGVTIELWKLSGSGHVWPGSDKSYPRILGNPTTLIDANEEMWKFFGENPQLP